MTPDDRREYTRLREHVRQELQAIDAILNRLTAIVAEDNAKPGTPPPQTAAREHELVLWERLRDGLSAALEALDHGDAERAGALFDQLEALKTQLFQS